MNSLLCNGDLTASAVLPLYFFYGEELFLAEQFVEDLHAALFSEDDEFLRERFNLAETSWTAFLDAARTVPFFQMARRLLVVDVPLRKAEKLSKADRKDLEDFSASPPGHSACVIIVHGKLRKNSVLHRIFSSLPEKTALVRELKPLKEREIHLWMDQTLNRLGKRAKRGAKARLLELVGLDLALLNNELVKVATFAADKNEVDEDDINQVSGWMKSYYDWELSNALEKRHYDRSLAVLDELLRKEGAPPEKILGLVVRIFRDILLAKIRLRLERTDKKTVFKALRPGILEYYGFYRERFRDFFALVDGITFRELSQRLRELARIDLKVKTTDSSFQVMMEEFLFEFCRKT